MAALALKNGPVASDMQAVFLNDRNPLSINSSSDQYNRWCEQLCSDSGRTEAYVNGNRNAIPKRSVSNFKVNQKPTRVSAASFNGCHWHADCSVRQWPGPHGHWSFQPLRLKRNRAIEHDLLPWCAQHAMPVMAYSPLGGATSTLLRRSHNRAYWRGTWLLASRRCFGVDPSRRQRHCYSRIRQRGACKGERSRALIGPDIGRASCIGRRASAA